MRSLSGAVATVLLSAIALAPAKQTFAADLAAEVKPLKAAPALPFFLVDDNRFTYAYMFKGTDPGAYSTRPDGSIDGKTAKQVIAFSHFDAWAYGTNLFNIAMYKSDHNDPASPCTKPGMNNLNSNFTACAGATEIYGQFRSTLGFNEIFNTKSFTWGPLHNVSFEAGLDANSENTFLGPSKRSVVGGLQFAFDLPYKGYFNIAPMAFWVFSTHSSFTQCGLINNNPGVNCLPDGGIRYDVTWAVEGNYYMDLNFLPPSLQYFSLSGRGGFYGARGDQSSPLVGTGVGPFSTATVVEFTGEPIRLTFDASKAAWGEKYAHFVDVWVAYRYWQNKFGFDHNAAPGVCTLTVAGVTRSTGTCTESSLYTGITVKF
jgi:hypothetical protein